MLIGYDKFGEIRFVFSDEDYLKTRYPKNSAKISDFWKVKNHGLKEMFVNFKYADVKKYKVVGGNLVKKSEEEIKATIIRESPPVRSDFIRMQTVVRIEGKEITNPNTPARTLGNFKGGFNV